MLTLVPFVYCDQNFVVTTQAGPEEYKAHLRQLAVAGTLTFVFSPMHWVEMAEDDDALRGTATADFVDFLNPCWLYERRTIQRKEISTAFFRFAGIPIDNPQMKASVIEVIADLAGVAAYRDSRAFVTHLHGVGPNHPLEQSLRTAFEANQANGADFRAGKLTPQFLCSIERLYIQQLLPKTTPAGLAIDAGTGRQFLDAYKLTDFPAFALETNAARDNWSLNRQLTQNNFLDQQHVMALPYVDLFVTDDQRLTRLIARITKGLPFQTAVVITKATFDARFPQARHAA